MTKKGIRIVLFLLCTVILIISANEVLLENLPEKKKQVILQPEPLSDGQYVSFYDNGNIKSIEYYENGQKQGSWLHYYDNGCLKQSIDYKNDYLDGYTSFFAKSGELIYEEKYSKGQFSELSITNDSLYKYEIRLESHGQLTFRRNCSGCHEVSKDIGLDEFNDIAMLFDSLQSQKISIDSLHLTSFRDSSLLEHFGQFNQWLIPFYSNKSLDSYDFEALYNYLERESEKQKVKPLKRLRKLSRRKKTV